LSQFEAKAFPPALLKQIRTEMVKNSMQLAVRQQCRQPGEETPNRLTLFIADDGAITLSSFRARTANLWARSISTNRSPRVGPTGKLVVDKTMPHASNDRFTPVKSEERSGIFHRDRLPRWRPRSNSAKW